LTAGLPARVSSASLQRVRISKLCDNRHPLEQGLPAASSTTHLACMLLCIPAPVQASIVLIIDLQVVIRPSPQESTMSALTSSVLVAFFPQGHPGSTSPTPVGRVPTSRMPSCMAKRLSLGSHQVQHVSIVDTIQSAAYMVSVLL
jgi:hypothetical protein